MTEVERAELDRLNIMLPKLDRTNENDRIWIRAIEVRIAELVEENWR